MLATQRKRFFVGFPMVCLFVVASGATAYSMLATGATRVVIRKLVAFDYDVRRNATTSRRALDAAYDKAEGYFRFHEKTRRARRDFYDAADRLHEKKGYDKYREKYKRFYARVEAVTKTYEVALSVSDVGFFLLSLLILIIAYSLLDAFKLEQDLRQEAVRANQRVIHDIIVPCVVVDAKTLTLDDANDAAVDCFGLGDSHSGFDVEKILPQYQSALLPKVSRSSFQSTSSSSSEKQKNPVFSSEGLPEQNSNTSDLSTQPPTKKQQRRAVVEKRHVQGLNLRTGETLQLLVHKRIQKSADGKETHTLIMNDITDELEIQKKILAQFTHEMRNKYVAATHMLEHIQIMSMEDNRSSDAEIRQELLAMHEDVKVSAALLHEADQLVQTRLSLHKVYNGSYKSQPNVQTFEVGEFMAMRVAGASALGAKSVDFRVEKTIAENTFIRTDTYMLNHIASNLLSNARKFTYTGTIIFRFLGETQPKSLEFSVVDTGVGMQPHVAARLFKEEVHNGDERGVGLGLVSCRKFAECIGGDVWLHQTKPRVPDDPLSGSELRFCLPGKIVKIEEAEPARRNSLSTPQPVKRRPSSSPRTDIPSRKDELPPLKHPPDSGEDTSPLAGIREIYIVEDSDMIRRTIKMKLNAVCKRAREHSGPWKILEFETVESLLNLTDNLKTILARSDLMITVDQNLDSRGGNLAGSDLIDALVKNSFHGTSFFFSFFTFALGIIVSISGDDATAALHERLGANVILGKPLPKNDVILRRLESACADKFGDDLFDRRYTFSG